MKKISRICKVLAAVFIFLIAESSVVCAANVVTLYMDTVSAPVGQQVVIDVKVRDFIMMLSAQGTLGFDTSELHFADVEHFGLAGFTASNFGTGGAASGYITFSWTDQTLNGASIANDSDFFAIRFTVSSHACQNTAVTFLNTHTAPEFVDTSFNTLPFVLSPGMVMPTGLSISASISPAGPVICSSQNTTLTASGGGTYVWSNNATTAAITVAPVATTPYTVTVTSNNGCSAQATDTVFVGSGVSPAVSVVASQTTVCAGTNITFTASATNGGSTPGYQWKKNGVNVGTNNAVYSNNALSNNDSVWVVLTSSSTCANPVNATSNVTHITISSGVTPGVTVSASQTTICTGTGVTFTAAPVNGGPAPGYQWKKNGNNVGTGLSTYYDNSLSNNDSVWVVLTSSLSCANPATATGNKAIITVNAIPSAPVAGSNSPLTAGQNISLTAGTIAGATYQWSGPNTYSSNLQNPVILNATTGMSGTYQVIATVNGCNSLASSVAVTVNRAVNAFVLYMDTVSVAAGQQVLVDIKARDFIMMLSAQGTIGFDTSELHFMDVEHYGLTSLSGSNFGTSGSANGYITFSWTDQTLNGSTLANDSDFFAIRFAVAGNACNKTAVNFLNTPTALEFVDTSFNTIAYTIHQGMVSPTGVGITAGISPVDPVSCVLQNTTLTASPGTTYAWSTNATTSSITVSPAVTTPYSVTVTGVNGCSAQATDTVFVAQTVVPSVSVSASATTICSGAYVIFNAAATNGGSAPVYQWKHNGVNVGTNSSTYSVNTLGNNDSVWVVMTSNAGCVSPASAASNVTYITISAGTAPAVSISASQTSICADSSITFTATPVYGGSTPVYQWKKNGANVGINSAAYTDNTFNNNDSVWVVMTSSASCANPLNATSNVIRVTINAGVVPSVTVSVGQTAVCAGTNVTFNATPVNGGLSPTYKWKKNGNIVGANSPTYNDSTLNNNDSVWVVLTSSANCANPAKVVSNIIYMTVNPVAQVSVSISASQTTICAGSGVTFTATATNGGPAPAYQWKKNGSNVGTNNAVYSDNSLNSNDSVWVVLTSNLSCASPTAAASNIIHITTSTSVTPSVSVNANQTNICAGTPVTFTASPTNGGTTPAYQWKKNGNNVGTNSPGYSDNALSNNDSVWVVLTSSVGCANPTTAKSNVVHITVTANVVPSVSVTAGQTTVCSGAPVTFTATATNGGNAPAYQWKKNGNNAGTGGVTYIDNALNNNDSVWVVLTSSSSCANPGTVSSNVVHITTNPVVVPSVTIGASQTTVCADSAVVFTATPINGGLAPAYQWKKNGVNVGSNSITYTDALPGNNDSVWVILTSSQICALPSTATSNIIQLTVNATVVPSVTVSASQTTICAGTTVVFTATSTNPGVSPIYKWKKNGNPAGSNSAIYSDNALNNNDSVWVTLTSTATCANPAKVVSNIVYIATATSVLPSVSVSATQTTICAGAQVTFTAAAVNGGTTPVYQWKKNGSNVGTNSATYSDNALSNNDSVWVILTSNASCANPTVVTGNKIHITISASVVPSVSISAGQTTICAGTGITFTATTVNGGTTPVYQWVKNGNNVGTNSAAYSDNGLNNSDSVWVLLTSNALCASPSNVTSNKVVVTVNPTPSVPVAGSNSPVNVGGTIALTAGNIAGAAYQWSGPNGYSSNQQNPTISGAGVGMAGTYQVIATVNGCNSPAATVAVVVNIPANSFVLYGDTITGADGQQVVVDVRARNFKMMLSAQGTVGFDTSKIHFVDVEHFGLAGLNASNFGTGAAANGYITFAWNDLTLNGQTLGNDSEFFAIRFKIDSGVCQSSAVTFLNAPTALEFVDTSLNPLNNSELQGLVKTTFAINDSLITAQGATTFCAGGSVTLNAASGYSYLWSNQSTAQNITVNAGGNYLVTVTNGYNCTAVSAATAVVVNPVPNATVTPGSATTFCAGDSVTLSAPVGLTYAWSNSATTQNIHVSAGGSNTVTVTNSNNCTAVSNAVVVTVNPLPNVTFVLPVDTICLHASPMTLTGGSPSGGVYSGTAIGGGSFNPATAGQGSFNITYTYTDSNTCSNSATASISVNICGGIDVISAFNWSIYPNPASGNLTISLNAGIVPVAFNIYDVLGNKITDGKITTGQYLLNINNFASGLYYLKIYHGEEIAVKSFVVFK